MSAGKLDLDANVKIVLTHVKSSLEKFGKNKLASIQANPEALQETSAKINLSFKISQTEDVAKYLQEAADKIELTRAESIIVKGPTRATKGMILFGSDTPEDNSITFQLKLKNRRVDQVYDSLYKECFPKEVAEKLKKSQEREEERKREQEKAQQEKAEKEKKIERESKQIYFGRREGFYKSTAEFFQTLYKELDKVLDFNPDSDDCQFSAVLPNTTVAEYRIFLEILKNAREAIGCSPKGAKADTKNVMDFTRDEVIRKVTVAIKNPENAIKTTDFSLLQKFCELFCNEHQPNDADRRTMEEILGVKIEKDKNGVYKASVDTALDEFLVFRDGLRELFGEKLKEEYTKSYKAIPNRDALIGIEIDTRNRFEKIGSYLNISDDPMRMKDFTWELNLAEIEESRRDAFKTEIKNFIEFVYRTDSYFTEHKESCIEVDESNEEENSIKLNFVKVPLSVFAPENIMNLHKEFDQAHGKSTAIAGKKWVAADSQQMRLRAQSLSEFSAIISGDAHSPRLSAISPQEIFAKRQEAEIIH